MSCHKLATEMGFKQQDIRLDESGFGFDECIRDASMYTCTR